MSTQQQTDEAIHLRAARAVLLFIRAATTDVAGVQTIRIGESEPTPIETAAECLARISKPIRCRASVAGDVLIVTHQPREEMSATEELMYGGWLRPALAATDAYAGEVLLRGAGDGMRLSRAVLEVLARDYALEVPHATSGDDPSAEEARQGIRWVIAVGSPAIITTDVNELNLPDDLRVAVEAEYRRVVAEHSGPAEA